MFSILWIEWANRVFTSKLIKEHKIVAIGLKKIYNYISGFKEGEGLSRYNECGQRLLHCIIKGTVK